jgi:small subunit ribosomal protein S15
MINSKQKKIIIKDYARSSKDTGSADVQVAILTDRINQLTEHMKINKHDFMTRRGLLQMVGKRKRLLKYIASRDSQNYLDLVQKLGIRH